MYGLQNFFLFHRIEINILGVIDDIDIFRQFGIGTHFPRRTGGVWYIHLIRMHQLQEIIILSYSGRKRLIDADVAIIIYIHTGYPNIVIRSLSKEMTCAMDVLPFSIEYHNFIPVIVYENFTVLYLHGDNPFY